MRSIHGADAVATPLFVVVNENVAVLPGTRFTSPDISPTMRFGNGTAVISSVVSFVATLLTAYS